MNIALVVFPFHPSHGCILQTFAIYRKLKEMGHKVTIINRKSCPISNWGAFKRGLSNLRRKLIGNYRGAIFYRGNAPKAIMQHLQPFIDTVFGEDVKTIYSYQEACELVKSDSFDAYIIGSDQVWRPKYVPDVYHYYLDFVPKESKAKRIAFCPSFGTDEWEYNKEQQKHCCELLSRFDAVAVREESGVRLCKKRLNKDAVHLLDPTVMQKSEDYLKAVELENSEKMENVVSYYFLDCSEEKLQILHKISLVLGCQEKRINTNTEDCNARLEDRIAPSLQTWISGFAKSRFVVADSFHATMFAVLFNVPFITIANKERGLSRFESLLKTFNLDSRLVTSPEAVTDELIQKPIDWNKANIIMSKEREHSLLFLREALS